MKDYRGFLGEAISARRLKELQAKGKGAAATQKMAADGLKSKEAKQRQKPEQKKLSGGEKGGSLAGGALATVPKEKSGGLTGPGSKVQFKGKGNKDGKLQSDKQQVGVSHYTPRAVTPEKKATQKKGNNKGSGVGNLAKTAFNQAKKVVNFKSAGSIGTSGGSGSNEPGVRYQ